MSVVLITGCSTGIGRGLARVCAAAGDRVFATMRRPAMAGGLEDPHGVTVLPLDVPAMCPFPHASTKRFAARDESTCSSTTQPSACPALSRTK